MVETPISVSDQPYFDLLFDPEWYLTRHPDVRTSGFTAIDHFHAHGLQENRSPHPLFHPQWYLDVNEDVAANGMPAFAHYLAYGIAEGRAPHPLFDPSFYIDRYGLSGMIPPIVQFLESGEAAGHVPTPLFDAAYYLERHADVVASKTLPFAHFIRTGFYRDYALSRLFDNKWYHRQNGDLDDDVSSVEHFLLFGIREERDPSPLFQSSWYRTKYRDRLQNKPVFRHYVENGHLRPNWLFDPGHVARQLTLKPLRQALLHPLISPGGAVASDETIVFTSIANNYMPFASVLAESLKRHNEHVRFVIVLCDEMDEEMDIPAGVDEILPVRVLFGDDFGTWAFQHDLVELCTAAKGFALEHFLARPSCKRVIYLDPDVYVTGALSIVQAALDDTSILVTPHLLSPEINPDAIEQNEFDALRHGTFNLGFLGVRNDAAGTRFAHWWRQRLTHYCVDRREDGLFVDQKWMDLAPGFFPELGILRHPGHNAAPWNLSRRKIEGNLLDGFKVDGQPLVFFHFSGHASGAGDGMLNRYGADMPAASLLSQAYRHRLTLASASSEPRPWSFAYYDNGVPIDAAERALYRKRKDLQARFTDPFSTANAENYLHWYRRTGDRNANVAHAHIAPLKSGRTMLERYLIASRTKPVHPNALFDAEFYSEIYSDVPRDAADAFAHYLHQGLAEGRQPCPSFDPAVYCKEAGFSNPTECLEDVLERGLDPAVRPVATFDPRFDVDVLAAMTADCEDGLPRILMISHDWGGGTGKHIEELTALLRGRAHVFRLTYQSGKKVKLVGQRQKHSLEFIVPRMADEVAVAIRQLGIERVHVHHVVGIEGWIETLLKALGRPYDVTLHDAYFLTPNPMFRLDREASSRSELDDAMAMAKGTPLNPLLPSGIDLSNWRERLSPILRFAERIIAPSEFIARLYRTVHPSLPIVVVPHHEMARAGLPLDVSRLGAKDVLTIAVIGEPLAHKGLEMLEACALLARERSLPIRFVALGTGTDSLEAAGVRLTGAYNDRDLPYLLDLFAIDVVWLPYSAPESYSYALTAALASGLIVAMTDVGCFPERIVGFPQAIMLPVATDSDQWLETFEALKKKLVDGTAETRPLVPQRGDFYPDRYLEVAPSVPSALP